MLAGLRFVSKALISSNIKENACFLVELRQLRHQASIKNVIQVFS